MRPQLYTVMDEIFNKEITKEEFNTVIAIASTITAPSPTGLTFNMIKNWQEEVKKTIFTSLYNLWSTKDVPTQKKWKWLCLCLKPKINSGIPASNDLRPLCLLGRLRKQWERLILKRITSVWDKQNTLNEAQHCRSGRG